VSPTVESTIALIRKAHAGQVDKIGAPYAEHPLAVMALLPPSADDEERMIALLHRLRAADGWSLDNTFCLERRGERCQAANAMAGRRRRGRVGG
jgi:hypothetical protein